MFVITQQDRQWATTQDLFFHGYPDGQKIQWFLFFLFLFCPNTVTAYVKGYTLYCIYAMWSPAQPARVRLTLVLVSNDGQGWRWWWIHGGVSVQSHQTCSDSVGDVNIHLMDLLPKPSRLRFRVVQNVVFISLWGGFAGEMINNQELEEIVPIFCMNLDSRGLEPLSILNSVALMTRKLEIWKVQWEAC